MGPVLAFRLNGLRKLNWAELSGEDYDAHRKAHGFYQWLELGPLTIVVGPHGGGKSTVIDLFRALADPKLWPSLSRENYGGHDFSGFDVMGSRFCIAARFSRWTRDSRNTFENVTLAARVYRPDGADHRVTAEAPKFGEMPGWDLELQDLLDTHVGVRVRTMSATGPHPSDGITDAKLIDLLNELARHFSSVMANPHVKPFAIFAGLGDKPGRIGVLFKDDPGMHAFVHRSMLPLGWLQLAAVLSFMRDCTSGDLILLDEPDRHLHPSLQRVLLELVAQERERLNAQVLLATHSSVLLNPELCDRAGARVIVTARGRCELLSDARRVLDDLGVASGDLAQANGVIWVEGPSDRIYIKHWLELYAAHIGRPAPIERVHYAFVPYGGAVLAHVCLSARDPDRVDLRAINRNFAVVIDRDLSALPDGGFAGDKGRLLAEAEALAADEALWITEDYTIESYLPDTWLTGRRHIRTDAQGRVIVERIAKVELARRFKREITDWPSSFAAGSDLGQRIRGLFDRINAWQSPQEIIEPAYYPSFLSGPPTAEGR
jgi:energy-coupling factor transporter ATP-binding protein EcfA2